MSYFKVCLHSCIVRLTNDLEWDLISLLAAMLLTRPNRAVAVHVTQKKVPKQSARDQQTLNLALPHWAATTRLSRGLHLVSS